MPHNFLIIMHQILDYPSCAFSPFFQNRCADFEKSIRSGSADPLIFASENPQKPNCQVKTGSVYPIPVLHTRNGRCETGHFALLRFLGVAVLIFVINSYRFSSKTDIFLSLLR
jgi:hypothetical protein